MAEAIEATIRTVAVRRLGAVDSSVVRMLDRSVDPVIGGDWFTLSMRMPGDSEWKPLGRRRTKLELLTLVNSMDPTQVDGRNFGTCGRDDHWN